MSSNRTSFTAQLLVLAALVVGLSLWVPEENANRRSLEDDVVDRITARVSADSILQTVKFLSAQKSRRFTSPGSEAAAAFIATRLEHWGVPVEIRRASARDSTGNSVVVTSVLGDLSRSRAPSSSLVMCAHFDSRGEDSRDIAPGADDNASGVAVLLEVARVLTDAGMRPRVTLAFFGGEEDRLIGSRAYAEAMSREGVPLRGVINIDMVGFDEYGPRDFVVFTNRQSIPLALEVIENARRTTRLVADTTVTTAGNSDHASFWGVGVPAVSIWEGYDHNPYSDTSRDTVALLTRDYLVEIARLAVSTAVHLGGTGWGSGGR